MKLRYILLVALTIAVSAGIPTAIALANPVSNVDDVEITVPAAKAKLTSITPTSGTWQSYSSVYIANGLTTCIRVGGPSLTATSGFEVGSGCRDGVGISLDATGDIWVMDDGGGTVAGVDVIRGKM